MPPADVTAKAVPHYRLGTFWALRNASGGAVGAAALAFAFRFRDLRALDRPALGSRGAAESSDDRRGSALRRHPTPISSADTRWKRPTGNRSERAGTFYVAPRTQRGRTGSLC